MIMCNYTTTLDFTTKLELSYQDHIGSVVALTIERPVL